MINPKSVVAAFLKQAETLVEAEVRKAGASALLKEAVSLVDWKIPKGKLVTHIAAKLCERYSILSIPELTKLAMNALDVAAG